MTDEKPFKFADVKCEPIAVTWPRTPIKHCDGIRMRHRFNKGKRCEVCGAINPKFDLNRNRKRGRPRRRDTWAQDVVKAAEKGKEITVIAPRE